MSSRERLRALVRLAALSAVGLSLLATSDTFYCDIKVATERLDYEVASDCGPAGRVQLFHEGVDDPHNIYHRCPDNTVVITGGAAVGLPEQGHLIDAPPHEWPRETRGIAAGDFVLAGDVTISGAVPAVTVTRVCRFIPDTTAGTLALVCIGPEPESACTGTLTPVPEAP